MVSVEKVDESLFTEVYPLLRYHNPRLTEADWRKIFNYKWDKEEEHCGYGLFDGKEIVGFLGLIFSKRTINNKIERICNLTTWIVKREYRNHSLSLILPVLKLKDHTITDLSPSGAVIRIAERLGFSELDSRLRIILPVKNLGIRRHSNECWVTHDKNLIESKLSDTDLRVFHDHTDYSSCGHLLAHDNDSYCHVIFTILKHTRFPYCCIQYISNPALFAKYSLKIRAQITKIGMSPFIIADSRLLQQLRLPFSYDLPFKIRKLYKSSSLRPEQVDNLYSEHILLNYVYFPTLRELVKKVFAPGTIGKGVPWHIITMFKGCI